MIHGSSPRPDAVQRGHSAGGEALHRGQLSEVHVAAAGRALHSLRGACWVIAGVVCVAAGACVVCESGVVVVGEVGRVVGRRVCSEARFPISHQHRD